jgi:SAM-dependent methyltransferase
MLLDRVFAAMYDRVLRPSEEHGLADIRRRTLAGLSGTVLEIGAGTGLNLGKYPDEVDTLIACEPTPEMAEHLRARADEFDHDLDIRDAVAEALPFPDDSVDHAVSTLVLCTVDDLDQSCGELARVIRPGGTLRLVEHIGPADGFLGGVQRTIEPAWKVGARGCRLTRDPREALAAAGFDVSNLQEGTMPAPKLIRRVLTGTAKLM